MTDDTSRTYPTGAPVPYRDPREALLQRLEALKSDVAIVEESLARLRTDVATAPIEPGAVAIPFRESPFGIACAAVGLVAMAAVVGVVVSQRVRPQADAPAEVVAADLPGGAGAVDVTAMLERARRRVPTGSELRGIDVRYASSDGTIDLTAPYGAGAEFTFQTPAPPVPAPTAPGRVGTPRPRAPTGSSICLRVTRDTEDGLADGCVRLFAATESVPIPRCSTARVWAAARARNAPREAVAHLKYGRELGFDHIDGWRVEIEGENLRCVVREPECL
jgi:hypothetical protein